MPKTNVKKNKKFGIGEYDSIQDNGQEALSKIQMRGYFLQATNKINLQLSDLLIGELMDLYRQIPLFCYSADIKRKKLMDENNRYLWTKYNRPRWQIIEDAWVN